MTFMSIDWHTLPNIDVYCDTLCGTFLTESNNKPQIILHHSKIELEVSFNSSAEYRKNKLYQWY